MGPAFDDVESAITFSLRLCELLRADGMRVGTGQVLACTRAIIERRALDHALLLTLYRVTLVNRREDFARLERLHALLLAAWLGPASEPLADPGSGESLEISVQRLAQLGEEPAPDGDEESTETPGYSVHEVDQHQDFRTFSRRDYPAVLKQIETLARRHASQARRRVRRSRREGRIDLRASLRDSARYDGEIMNWHYRRRRPVRTRLVAVVDVSGSMQVYTTFLLGFLHALARNRLLSTEIFAFSTGLQRLTESFRLRDFTRVREHLAARVAGWSGGTRIGQAIACLNESHAPLVSPRTVVAIISDGWDTGDTELLDREMTRLSARARSIVWINPLKGDPSYQPLAIGMATARPYCDAFISGHCIDALGEVAGLLEA